jgi:hypothetical protein
MKNIIIKKKVEIAGPMNGSLKGIAKSFSHKEREELGNDKYRF